jgi:hypothetical protein
VPPAPPPEAPFAERMRLRTATTAGRALDKLRQQAVEPVFGIIKAALGFRRFSLRGLAKVTLAWKWVCLASNRKRLHRLGAALRAARPPPVTSPYSRLSPFHSKTPSPISCSRRQFFSRPRIPKSLSPQAARIRPRSGGLAAAGFGRPGGEQTDVCHSAWAWCERWRDAGRILQGRFEDGLRASWRGRRRKTTPATPATARSLAMGERPRRPPWPPGRAAPARWSVERVCLHGFMVKPCVSVHLKPTRQRAGPSLVQVHPNRFRLPRVNRYFQCDHREYRCPARGCHRPPGSSLFSVGNRDLELTGGEVRAW